MSDDALFLCILAGFIALLGLLAWLLTRFASSRKDQSMTDKLTKEDLLPCPFCGRSDTTRYGRSSEFHEDCDGGDGGNDDYFAVFCDASEPRGLGGCGASGGFAKTHEEAAERWNRRPTVEPSGDARDAARYRYLRDDHAYEPEEQGVRGGESLDDLCDFGIAENRDGES